MNLSASVKHLYSEMGFSLKEVGQTLGIPCHVIKKLLVQEGVPLRTWNRRPKYHHKKRKGQIVTCEACGIKFYREPSAIGANTFCSLNCRDKFKYLHPRFTKEELERLYQLEGLSLTQMSNLFSMSVQGILRWLKKYNIPRRPAIHDMPHRQESIDKMKTAPRANNIPKPTSLEKKLIEIMKTHGFPYRYVGNGSVWFDGLCPDFINVNGAKGIIEVFGEYWHTGAVRSWRQMEGGRITHFARFGFKTLILWENELKNEKSVVRKIKRFTNSLNTGVL